MNAALTLTHAAEYMQSTSFSFTNLTADNLGRQQAAALLRRKAREAQSGVCIDPSPEEIAEAAKSGLPMGPTWEDE